MAKIKFSKVSNNQITDTEDYVPSIKMGIDKAPSSLIVQYITNMYTAPLEAAIRETISNAFDSCSKNKNTNLNECVRVTVGENFREAQMFAGRFFQGSPTHRYISVEDKGVGMSYDQLVNIYTQYGISNKRDEENSIGAFGLGSKSPLAYTNEFHIITKAKEGEVYYLCAYKTRNSEFIANLPIKIENDKLETSLYRNEEFIIPCKQTDAGTIEPVEKAKHWKFTVKNPFEKNETGTVVIFPLDDKNDKVRAEIIVHMVDEILRKSKTGQITNDKIFIPYGGFYYETGSINIIDDEKNTIECKVYLSDKISKVISTAYAQRDTIKENIAFKVGAWLYPATGEAWRVKARGNYTQVPEKYPIIIEVPSRALSFIPSRDTIIADGEERGNTSAIIGYALQHIRSKFNNVDSATDIYNWLRSNSRSTQEAFTNMFNLRYCEMVYGKAKYSNGKSNPKTTDTTLTVKQYSHNIYRTMNRIQQQIQPYCEIVFDTKKMIAGIPKGFSIDEMKNTPNCLVGLISADKGEFKNKGVYAVGDNPISQILGSCGVQKIGKIDIGYKFTKAKAAGDNIVAQSNTSYSPVEIVPRGAADDAIALGLNMTCQYPAGLSLIGLEDNLNTNTNYLRGVIIVDASKCGLTKARNAVSKMPANIDKFKNLQSGELLYILIPPKTQNTNDTWTDKEITAIEKQLTEAVLSLGSLEVEVVRKKDFEAKTKKDKTVKESTPDLNKMFSNNRTCTLVNKYSNTIYKAFDGKFATKDTNVLDKMTKEPSTWGVIVASDKYKNAHEQAHLYAKLLFIMDMIPAPIKNIVCVSSKNFNAARGNALKNMGITLIYDEAQKADYKAVVAAGSLFMTEKRTVFSSSENPYKINYAGIVPKTIKPQLTYYILKKYESEIIRKVEKAFGTGTNNSMSIEGMVSLATYGREKYSFTQTERHIEWIQEMFDNIIWSEDIKLKLTKIDNVEKIKNCLKIWDYFLSKIGVEMDGNKFTDSNIDSYKLIGEVLGIDYAIESLYQGCPLEDILT